MKLRFQIHRPAVTLLLVALLGPAAVHADPPQPAAPAKATAPALASPTNVVAEIPQSVFLVTSATQAIRDPFFPNSTRFAPLTTTKTNQPVAVVADLVLKGLSGTAARPLATINNRILEPGEEQEVATSSGKVRVRCVEINLKDESVVVEAGGVRRELRFSRAKAGQR